MTSSSLADLYQRTSKHSNYQVLPAALQSLVHDSAISVKSRFERERLAYILRHLPPAGRHWADIGGNTGFFSFELIAEGAARVDYHEGNAVHHDFVRAAAQELGLTGRLHTHQGYVGFGPDELAPQDATLLLNVLHHLGDDFGDAGTAKEAAKGQMLGCLSTLSRSSGQLVFQLGFNWKGDRHLPLFERGTKQEMIDFVRRGTAADWDILAIGVAQRQGSQVVFTELDDHNIRRDDALGEFLNRPLFIMRSRHFAGKEATP